MAILRIPLRVGEVLSATVRRKLDNGRVVISFKGHTLVVEPEGEVSAGDKFLVRVVSICPRPRLHQLPAARRTNPRSVPVPEQTETLAP